METITRKQVIEVFRYLDDFLDMMCDIDATPEELVDDIIEYHKLKHKVSEDVRCELYARLFIKYVQLCKK
jgi:hypothetical protein